jgi:hypothetical protein
VYEKYSGLRYSHLGLIEMTILPPTGIGLDVMKKIDISTELRSGPEDLSELGNIDQN